jgi:hypothetical protein
MAGDLDTPLYPTEVMHAGMVLSGNFPVPSVMIETRADWQERFDPKVLPAINIV